jgi:hypothetical protein
MIRSGIAVILGDQKNPLPSEGPPEENRQSSSYFFLSEGFGASRFDEAFLAARSSAFIVSSGRIGSFRRRPLFVRAWKSLSILRISSGDRRTTAAEFTSSVAGSRQTFATAFLVAIEPFVTLGSTTPCASITLQSGSAIIPHSCERKGRSTRHVMALFRGNVTGCG